jgi:hypothetical protein
MRSVLALQLSASALLLTLLSACMNPPKDDAPRPPLPAGIACNAQTLRSDIPQGFRLGLDIVCPPPHGCDIVTQHTDPFRAEFEIICSPNVASGPRLQTARMSGQAHHCEIGLQQSGGTAIIDASCTATSEQTRNGNLTWNVAYEDGVHRYQAHLTVE